MSTPGYLQIEGLQQFESLRRRANLRRFLHKLTGRPQTLVPFGPILARLRYQHGFNRGIREIPLKQIIGSLERANDFDRSFRPLHKKLRERWIKIWTLQNQGGLEPILVHKVGNIYFVEDGHHRVSVARGSGLRTIEAEEIEYQVAFCFPTTASLDELLGRLIEPQLEGTSFLSCSAGFSLKIGLRLRSMLAVRGMIRFRKVPIDLPQKKPR